MSVQLNLLQQEDYAKSMPTTALVEYLKNPSGQLQSYIVAGVLKNRVKQEKDMQTEQQQMPEGTAIDQLINEAQQPIRPSAGGHPQGGMPQGPGLLDDPNNPVNMNQQQYQQRIANPPMMPPGNGQMPMQDMPPQGMLPQQMPPQGMYSGGVVRMQGGGGVPYWQGGIGSIDSNNPARLMQLLNEAAMRGDTQAVQELQAMLSSEDVAGPDAFTQTVMNSPSPVGYSHDPRTYADQDAAINYSRFGQDDYGANTEGLVPSERHPPELKRPVIQGPFINYAAYPENVPLNWKDALTSTSGLGDVGSRIKNSIIDSFGIGLLDKNNYPVTEQAERDPAIPYNRKSGAQPPPEEYPEPMFGWFGDTVDWAREGLSSIGGALSDKEFWSDYFHPLTPRGLYETMVRGAKQKGSGQAVQATEEKPTTILADGSRSDGTPVGIESLDIEGKLAEYRELLGGGGDSDSAIAKYLNENKLAFDDLIEEQRNSSIDIDALKEANRHDAFTAALWQLGGGLASGNLGEGISKAGSAWQSGIRDAQAAEQRGLEYNLANEAKAREMALTGRVSNYESGLEAAKAQENLNAATLNQAIQLAGYDVQMFGERLRHAGYQTQRQLDAIQEELKFLLPYINGTAILSENTETYKPEEAWKRANQLIEQMARLSGVPKTQ